ncbi:MAG: isocitrate lyase/phosphoenolpyruvate mutase family protein [Chitinophagaceae bacterium]|nr:isocitrate lyase/phosphoenolpyruvate mutase family protein [Chitinophagaceae bacterium]
MANKFDPVIQNKLAEKFHSLHHAEEMLVLPNAWDSASARIFQESGFPAVATTSSGVSWSLGYKDGEHTPPELVIEVIGRMAGAISIPLTADIEAGYYGNDLDKFSKFIADVIEAGAVGINLEDADSHTKKLYDLDRQLAKIKAVKEVSRQKGVNLFLNARTDAIELAPGDLKEKAQACIERAKAFEDAGADGIFVPFVPDMETIAFLKKGIKLPLNVLMGNTLDVAELRKLKINRVSIGGKPMLATLEHLKKIAGELRSGNDWPSLFTKDLTYPQVNNWFK